MPSLVEGMKSGLSSPGKTLIAVLVVLIIGILLLIAGGIMLGIGIHKSNEKTEVTKIYYINQTIMGGGQTQVPVTPTGGPVTTGKGPTPVATTPANNPPPGTSGSTPTPQAGSTLTPAPSTGSTPTPNTTTTTQSVTTGSTTHNPLDNGPLFGNLTADIAVLLDISTATNNNVVADIKSFFALTFQAFDVITGPGSNGSNGIHFAFFRVPGDNWNVTLYSASFNTITSLNLLNTVFNNAAVDPEMEPPAASGQKLLIDTLKFMQNLDFINDGYRNSINNHLALYITTNSVPSNEAITLAGPIRQNTQTGFKFMAIQYLNDDMNVFKALSDLVGGDDCVIQASTRDQLLSIPPAWKLAMKIHNATTITNGDYQCGVLPPY